MSITLEQLSARMRQGEDIPLSDTARRCRCATPHRWR